MEVGDIFKTLEESFGFDGQVKDITANKNCNSSKIVSCLTDCVGWSSWTGCGAKRRPKLHPFGQPDLNCSHPCAISSAAFVVGQRLAMVLAM